MEDLSRNYRPLVLEMKRWPRPLCHASLKASPFDPPHTGKSPEQQQQQKMGGGGGGREKEKVEVRDKRPGHCECCSVKFEDLQMVSSLEKNLIFVEFGASCMQRVFNEQPHLVISSNFCVSTVSLSVYLSTAPEECQTPAVCQ